MKKRTVNTLIGLVVVVIAAFFSNGNLAQNAKQIVEPLVGQQSTENKVSSVENSKLQDLTFKSGDNAYVVVNNNKSTLKAADWKHNKIDYGNLDRLNRTTTATGYLDRNNLVKSSTRTEQRWRPTGWHQKRLTVNGRTVEILNRGHLLAYSVTGNFDENGKVSSGSLGSLDNPKNLASQTEFSNQRTMQIFEQKVRNALEDNKKVIYQVSTVFKGNDLMPIGYHSQALSTDGSLNFNVFIWNVEPGVKFDYATGRSVVDRTMQVKTVSNN